MTVPGTVSMDMATPQRGALDHRDDGHAGGQMSQTMITRDQIVHKRWFEGQMAADMLDLAGFVDLTTRGRRLQFGQLQGLQDPARVRAASA